MIWKLTGKTYKKAYDDNNMTFDTIKRFLYTSVSAWI